ncbi:phage tail family protein [Hespellia stercorisuis]|uniref:Phage tail protein n=1 Tax=Hespellia stercorisuis DSM 15480 TaxID=1121950 RepID=A0A1M6MWV9_9FIRM|nr:phage tail domain-containing protein [Hespellia stercorisuis]SHJ87763.1 Phage tail protein [Hespellia stercorisuis DSM 15480]
MNVLTNGATIEVVSTGECFHTINDWHLAIGNNNCIGDPEQETFYLDIPGADGFLDMSEATTGRRIFKNRPVTILLGGKNKRNDWDIIVSDIRNKIEGREVKIIFDNDPGFYWIGRAKISDFDRNREIGSFTLAIPKADPYKYNVADSTEDWLWDSFDFETGIIDEGTEITVTPSGGTKSYTIIPDIMPFVPVIQVSQIGTAGITMTTAGKTYTLVRGKNRFADIVVDQEDVTLSFTGQGTLTIRYRRGSL